MKPTSAYSQSQAVTLEGERAFEELYARLGRWSAEAENARREEDFNAAAQKIDRCISLLGYMNLAIDLSANYQVASAVLSLHKFAIGALIQAKAEPGSADLEELPMLFVNLAEIFAAMRAGRTADPRVS
jgi:flagellin-specific chaperone FliS